MLFSKNKGMSLVVVLIILAVYNTIVFVLPFNRGGGGAVPPAMEGLMEAAHNQHELQKPPFHLVDENGEPNNIFLPNTSV